MYPKNAASPPPIFATVVKAADGTPITSGVAAKYSVGADQGAGAGTLRHEGNGQHSYVPTQAETNVDGFGVQFYHADAVGTGPTVSVVTDALVSAIRADTTELLTRVPDAGAAVAGEAAMALAAYDPPTKAEMDDAFRVSFVFDPSTAGATYEDLLEDGIDAIFDEPETGHTGWLVKLLSVVKFLGLK